MRTLFFITLIAFTAYYEGAWANGSGASSGSEAGVNQNNESSTEVNANTSAEETETESETVSVSNEKSKTKTDSKERSKSESASKTKSKTETATLSINVNPLAYQFIAELERARLSGPLQGCRTLKNDLAVGYEDGRIMNMMTVNTVTTSTVDFKVINFGDENARHLRPIVKCAVTEGLLQRDIVEKAADTKKTFMDIDEIRAHVNSSAVKLLIDPAYRASLDREVNNFIKENIEDRNCKVPTGKSVKESSNFSFTCGNFTVTTAGESAGAKIGEAEFLSATSAYLANFQVSLDRANSIDNTVEVTDTTSNREETAKTKNTAVNAEVSVANTDTSGTSTSKSQRNTSSGTAGSSANTNATSQ